LQPGVLRYPSVAVVAATGGTRAPPAVRKEASARWGERGDGGWSRKQRRDFERGSVVEVVVAEVVGEGDGEGRERRKRRWRRHRVSWRKRWQGVESESTEVRRRRRRWALGVGCLATGETRPRYSEISLYCFRSGSHISPARLTRFFRVGRSNPEKWLTDRTDDHPTLRSSSFTREDSAKGQTAD